MDRNSISRYIRYVIIKWRFFFLQKVDLTKYGVSDRERESYCKWIINNCHLRSQEKVYTEKNEKDSDNKRDKIKKSGIASNWQWFKKLTSPLFFFKELRKFFCCREDRKNKSNKFVCFWGTEGTVKRHTREGTVAKGNKYTAIVCVDLNGLKRTGKYELK